MGESLALVILISVFAVFAIIFAVDQLILKKKRFQNVKEHLTNITQTLMNCDFPFSTIEECQIAVLKRLTKGASLSYSIAIMSEISALNHSPNVTHYRKKQEFSPKTTEEFLNLLEEWPELENVPDIKNFNGSEIIEEAVESIMGKEEEQPKCICGLCFPGPPGSLCSPAGKEKIKKVLAITESQQEQQQGYSGFAAAEKTASTKKAPQKKKTEDDFKPIHHANKELDLS